MTDKPANFADSIGRAAQCGSDEESGMQLRHHASLKTAAKDLSAFFTKFDPLYPSRILLKPNGDWRILRLNWVNLSEKRSRCSGQFNNSLEIDCNDA